MITCYTSIENPVEIILVQTQACLQGFHIAIQGSPCQTTTAIKLVSGSSEKTSWHHSVLVTKTRFKDDNFLNSCKSDFNCNAKRKHKDNLISIREKNSKWEFFVKIITDVLKMQLDLNLIVRADSSVAIISPVPV